MEAAPAGGGAASYFDDYNDVDVHALMLKDVPRVERYREALERAAAHRPGLTVLDVGAGTGLLACLAARAGASKVYAVEASGMAKHAEEVVRRNGLAGVVEVLQQRVEDVELDGPVDAIVSEWMGFHLLHEGMLDAVLLARDRWLKPGGLLLPARACVFAAPVDMTPWRAENIDFWSSVAGIDFSPLAEVAAERALASPVVTSVTSSRLVAPAACVGELDCTTVSREDATRLGGDGTLRFAATRLAPCHGYAVWFEVLFDVPDGSEPTVLSTAPDAPLTHWQQSVVMLPGVVAAVPGSRLDARVALHADAANPRHYVLTVELPVDEGAAGEGGEDAAGQGDGDDDDDDASADDRAALKELFAACLEKYGR